MALLNPQQRRFIVSTLRGSGYLCLVVWVALPFIARGWGAGPLVDGDWISFVFSSGVLLLPPALILLWLAHFIKLGGTQNGERQDG